MSITYILLNLKSLLYHQSIVDALGVMCGLSHQIEYKPIFMPFI